MEKLKKSEQSRQAILAAAEIEFSEKGLYGARIDEIASRSGINKRMIYQYFGNKNGLYKTVLVTVYNRLGACESEVIGFAGECLDEIRQMIRAYFYFLKNNPTYVRMVMWENLNYAASFQENNLGGIRNPVKIELKRLISEGKSKGIIRQDINDEQVLQTLFACSFNYFSNIHTMCHVLNRNLLAEDVIEERIHSVTDMVMQYICQGGELDV